MSKKIISALLIALMTVTPIHAFAGTVSKVLPEGTRIYIKLDEFVSGKRGKAEAGDIVRCSIWRDVALQGITLVKAGTAAACKVESVKHSNIAGIKGKIVLAALDTTTLDGQKLQLTGGYNKEGKSRMAMTISLGALVFLPLIFITGSAAELPEGTVIDVYSGPDLPIVVQGSSNNDLPLINLGGEDSAFSANALLDDFFVPNAKPEVFKIQVTKQGPLPSLLVIDNVNGKSIEPISLSVIDTKSIGGNTVAVATVGIKTLSKHFQKGINRFEISFTEAGQRVSSEVVLNIQI